MIVAELELRDDRSVVTVRRAARLIAECVGLSIPHQTRLAAAASEAARAAREGSAGPLRFRLAEQALRLEIEGLAAGEVSIGHMVDRVEVEDGTLVLVKHLPAGRPPDAAIEALKLRLLTADPQAAAEEIRRQNAELLVALEEQRAAEEAQRRSEERLRQAVTATRLGTWELADRWVLSERAQELFGVEDPNADPTLALAQECRERFESALDELRSAGTPLELELEVRPGVWVVLRALLQRGWVVGTVLDVSERRQREEEARIRAELEKLLVGVVSHDLRSPLGTMKMGVHMLAEAELDEVQRTVLERMEGSVDTASQLVHDLLDFTQARLGGGIPIDPSEHDGHWLVGEVLDGLRVAHPGRTIAYQRRGDGTLCVDGERLKQVVMNLLSNALAHSPDHTAVRVETESDGEHFHLRVHNEGEPIPADAQARIFEPLQQGNGDNGSKGSLGLGLFIVKHVAEAHGGTVYVSSSEASGTTFALSLPLRQ